MRGISILAALKYVNSIAMILTRDEIKAANQRLKCASASDIVRWAVGLGSSTIATTSFGPNSGALLHVVAKTTPKLPIIWVDSGYNVPDCYRTADQLTQDLKLNLHVYTPTMTAERRTALEGGIPTLDETERHRRFTHDVKLEPFQRALLEHRPKVWISGIRKTETEHRQSLDIVSVDSRGILKVAPLFHWRDAQLETYMREHNLPSCKRYFDPTKVIAGRECGLHTAA